MIFRWTLFTGPFLLTLFSTSLWARELSLDPTRAQSLVSVMSYNVENLFDLEHDEGKNDWSYLPMSTKQSDPRVFEFCATVDHYYYRKSCYELDWSAEVLGAKLANLAQVISSYDSGRGPDILVLQEVENIHVLNFLNEWERLGYREIVLLEGPDERGIDVAIMSKYPLQGRALLHEVDLSSTRKGKGEKVRPTRGILQATFAIHGHPLTIFANHWSSQGHDDDHRLLAAQTLYRAMSKVTDHPVLAMGDFNTLDSDNPHGLNLEILNPDKAWFMRDAQVEAQQRGVRYAGTHAYKGKWSFLDKILVRSVSVGEECQPRKTCLEVHWESFQVHAPSYALEYETEDQGGNSKLRPKRFDPETKEGYSDHLPVALKFTIGR